MKRIVMDINVLVSALLSPNGNPAKVLALVMNGKVTACYDSRVMLEYESVLMRRKFTFESQDVWALLNIIQQIGAIVIPEPTNVKFTDEEDTKFYEVAKTAGAYLVTGNIKHFPEEDWIILPAAFLMLD